jgi:hypothetical protein
LDYFPYFEKEMKVGIGSAKTFPQERTHAKIEELLDA